LTAGVLPEFCRECGEKGRFIAFASQIFTDYFVLEPQLVEARVANELAYSSYLIDKTPLERRSESRVNALT
jgi:hypothetical protein